jgi:phosphoribosylglycinamide formyltransferase-1
MTKKQIAVFISGRGSNFKAILTEVQKGRIRAEIVAVISDNPEAEGLRYAEENGIEYRVFRWNRKEPRQSYFHRLMEYLRPKNIDLIILAGFMLVLSRNIVHRYKNRIMNIHPALLPAFPGENAQEKAFDHGVKISGCTVHFIDERVDTGPIILQKAVPVLDDDDAETLAERILRQEHTIFPEAVRLFCEDRLIPDGRRVYIRDETERNS